MCTVYCLSAEVVMVYSSVQSHFSRNMLRYFFLCKRYNFKIIVLILRFFYSKMIGSAGTFRSVSRFESAFNWNRLGAVRDAVKIL